MSDDEKREDRKRKAESKEEEEKEDESDSDDGEMIGPLPTDAAPIKKPKVSSMQSILLGGQFNRKNGFGSSFGVSFQAKTRAS